MAAPGEHLHLVGHARLELADGVATPSPAKTTLTKVRPRRLLKIDGRLCDEVKYGAKNELNLTNFCKFFGSTDLRSRENDGD